MKKKLTQIGNSLAVVIDKPILELLKIDKDTVLELSTQNGGLVISPVREGQNAEEIEEILKDLDAQYGSVFKNLA